MDSFTVDDFDYMYEDGGSYADIWLSIKRGKEAFGWWCLGHNFDVVATILTMSHLSWEQGFNAGRVIAGFCEDANTNDS